MTEAPKHLIRTASLPAAEAARIRHPLNPNSDVCIQRLSERTGMSRVVVSLARVPPGKESFIPHAHLRDEEFLYILEGHGMALIGDAEVAVGPGDFMGFPTDGTPHHLKNTGNADLVYLMGGERSAFEVARFPTVGKLAVFTADGARFFDEAAAQTVGFADFVAED
jgi:uncharacterized cupin superfamily protein